MALESITREEFDRRLDTANSRHAQELQAMEEQQMKTEQLLAQYERTLDDIEGELDNAGETAQLPVLLRQRLNELAERTAQVAASV